MSMDILSNSVSTTLAASQQASAVKKDAGTSPVVEVPKESVASVNAAPDKPAVSLEVPKEKLQDVVNKLQDYVDKYERDLKFSVDEDTGKTVVRLLDSDNNVVKQYPTEEALSLLHNLEQNKGLFMGQA